MCLRVLILFGIFSQGFIRSFAEENIKESSDILLRQKRVINRLPGEDLPLPITDRPYIVQVKLFNRIHCAGSILSHYFVITAAQCAQYRVSELTAISRASRTNRGTHHNVTEIRMHYGNHDGRPMDGVALLKVDPPFQYSQYTHNIELHTGTLFPGQIVTVSGWGFDCRDERPNRGTEFPSTLRSIQVPILRHRDCVIRYERYHTITEKDVCTYHRQKKCGHNDGGAPLVVDGQLAAIYLWSGKVAGQNDPDYPDVYAIVQHEEYRRWIMSNLRHE